MVGSAVATLQDRVLLPHLDAADLTERTRRFPSDRSATFRASLVGSRRSVPSVRATTSDGADVLANLRNGRPGQQELHLPSGLARREADLLEPLLVDDEVDPTAPARPSPRSPGELGLLLLHRRQHLVGDRTHLSPGPDRMTRNATGHGEYGPNTKRAARTSRPGNIPSATARRKLAIHHALRLFIRRRDDQLREIRVREFRVVREVEPRRTADRVGGDDPCLGLLLEPRLPRGR